MPISLFEAEKRGRKGEEDILTSKVFGILSKVDGKKILQNFLKVIGVSIPLNELANAEIELWKDYNGTVPDVSIETQSNIIFIECKVNSPVSIEQLKRELVEANKFRKSVNLICLTKDFIEPNEVKQLKQDYPEIIWTNWQTINSLLRNTELNKLDELSNNLISDLSDFLGSKGYRGFAGFKKDDVQNIMNGNASMHTFFNEISIYIGELQGLLKTNNIELKTPSGAWFHRDGRGTRLDYPGGWIMEHITFAFGLLEWPFSSYYNDSYLFLRFYIDDDEESKMVVGYTIRSKSNQSNQQLIFNKRESICAELIDNNIELLMTETWSELDYEIYSGEDLKLDILNKDLLNNAYRTEFCTILNFNELIQPNLLKKTHEILVKMMNIVTKLGITPNDLTSEALAEPQEAAE